MIALIVGCLAFVLIAFLVAIIAAYWKIVSFMLWAAIFTLLIYEAIHSAIDFGDLVIQEVRP